MWVCTELFIAVKDMKRPKWCPSVGGQLNKWCQVVIQGTCKIDEEALYVPTYINDFQVMLLSETFPSYVV